MADPLESPEEATVETVLERARAELGRLAACEGSYAVACKTTGVRPAPVTGRSFDSYEDAERARDAAAAYRDALRRVDPALTDYDLVVTETAADSVDVASVRVRTTGRRANGLPRASHTVTVAGDRSDEWLRVDNGPIVHLSGRDAPLDDEFVGRQLHAKL